MSHLDLMRAFERSFRRARLPLAFSEGFNPHPKVSFASALAVGVTSEGEYLDLELNEDSVGETLKDRINEVLPIGISILELKKLEKRTDSLMAMINMARYRVSVELLQDISQAELESMVAKMQQLSQLIVVRQGKKGLKEIDIKPGMFSVNLHREAGNIVFEMELQTGSSGNVKPEEVVEALKKIKPNILGEILQIHRKGLYIIERGRVLSPMDM